LLTGRFVISGIRKVFDIMEGTGFESHNLVCLALNRYAAQKHNLLI